MSQYKIFTVEDVDFYFCLNDSKTIDISIIDKKNFDIYTSQKLEGMFYYDLLCRGFNVDSPVKLTLEVDEQKLFDLSIIVDKEIIPLIVPYYTKITSLNYCCCQYI